MAATVLSLVILGPAAVVVVALFLALWRERTSAREARVAILAGAVLSLWAVVAFPMAVVPTFLVPLAFTIHVVSLWQLRGHAWVSRPTASFAPSR